MKGLAICLKGLEDIAATEIGELIKAKPLINDTALIFPVKKTSELAKLCYRAQSLIKVLALLDQTEVNNHLEETLSFIKGKIEKIDFGDLLKNRTFKVHCKRIGTQDYSSQDIAPVVGEYIIQKTEAKVSVTEPDVIIYVYIYGNSCYFGIDYSGFDLSRRDYRVFTHPSSISSTLAYALLRLAGFDKGTLADPFCGSGVVPIEAALYSEQRSPHYFKKDKFAFHNIENINLDRLDRLKKPEAVIMASDHILKFVKATKSNAKLAGVEKLIKVTRMDIEWLDTKIDESSLDCIVTNPPSASKHLDAKTVIKLYKEFFYQADFVLKKKGKIVLCVQRDEELKSCLERFKVSCELSVWQGGQALKILILQKNI